MCLLHRHNKQGINVSIECCTPPATHRLAFGWQALAMAPFDPTFVPLHLLRETAILVLVAILPERCAIFAIAEHATPVPNVMAAEKSVGHRRAVIAKTVLRAGGRRVMRACRPCRVQK